MVVKERALEKTMILLSRDLLVTLHCETILQLEKLLDLVLPMMTVHEALLRIILQFFS